MPTPVEKLIGGLRVESTPLLFEYAQETLDSSLKTAMDEHLKDCKPCLDYIDTYRATIKATHQCCPCEVEIPPELRAKLQEFIGRL